MLETFTPAVCRSRKRQIVAQVLFGASAVVAATALGLALGLVGSALGAERAVLVAAGLALVAAAREAGLLRFAVPQSRRQVPERWRFELPLPVWATGYGAGLGVGFFTFQPVSTYWVACAGALALARPVPAALCFSLYGAGRVLTIVWPRRRDADPTAAVERLVSRRGMLLRANVVALGACALLLGLAPVAGGAVHVAGNAYDPSYHAGTIAYATQGGDVVVKSKHGPNRVYQNASEPSLSGQLLAYVDGAGIRVLRWANNQQVARVGGTNVSRPALNWPLLAYVRRDAAHKRLVVRNLRTGTSRVHTGVKRANDLGRPSLRHGRLAWHTVARGESRIVVRSLSSGRKRVVAKSKVAMLTNPSLYRSRIVWVELRPGSTFLKQGWVSSVRRRNLARIGGRTRRYWTTGLVGRTAYFTRWHTGSGTADIFRTKF